MAMPCDACPDPKTATDPEDFPTLEVVHLQTSPLQYVGYPERDYTLRCMASDGALAATRDVQVKVTS